MAYLARGLLGYMVKEIVDHFRRSAATIGEAIRKVEDLLRTDKRKKEKIPCFRCPTRRTRKQQDSVGTPPRSL